MIKKLGNFFSIFIIFSALVACSGGSYTVTMGNIETKGNELSGKYNSFSGHYFKKIMVEDGETLTGTFTVETKEGNLKGKVVDSNGKIIKTLREGDSFTINEPGKYKLQVEGEKHKGSFLLTWGIN